ncbi:MAG: energy-coupling factor ABC transporter ATP-binding protein [Candidatus Brocadiia bacterium]
MSAIASSCAVASADKSATADGAVIQVEALSFAYPDGRRALDGLSLAVREGEKVGLIGPNGAGKSTLLLHLNGILPCDGRVRVLGMKVEKPNLKAVRQSVGLVFQNPDDQLFCPTVGDDVAFGPRQLRLPEAEVAARVEASLAAVGLRGFEARSAFHMSFGEKKRVAIATVLSMNPKVLALDEPTSNLDPRSRKELIRLLRRLGGTQIIASHDLDLVRTLCDRAVLLSKGQAVAEGEPGKILGDVALLEAHGLE